MVNEVHTQAEDYIEIKIPKKDEDETNSVVKSESEEKSSTPEHTKKKVAKRATSKKTTKPITPKTKKKSSGKKSSGKKTAPKKAKSVKKQVKEQNNALWAALLIIGLIVIGVVIYLSLQEPLELDTNNDDRVAALVNGEAVYVSEVDELYAKFPDSTKATTTKEDVLDQLIEQKVLLQEAKTQNVVASEEELDAYVQDMLLYFGFTEEQLGQVLAQQGISMEDFMKSTEDQVILAKLINESVLMKITISDEEAEAYYTANTEVFVTPESVLVKHILISTDANTTAEDVLVMIDEDKANFCDLVAEYSEDPGSISTCGEYTVMENGQFVPSFEEAAFDMELDELRIVPSDFGNHIMWKAEAYESTTATFDEAKVEIKGFLAQQKSSEEVPVYIANLRDLATIEIYSLEEEVATPEATTPAPIEVEAADEEEREVVVEKTKPARTDDFGACLADLKATMYGVDWAPDVEEQKTLLGDAFDHITYVDCDEAACDGISVYPTWTFGEGDDLFILTGKQSLNSLERETGCMSA